MTVSRTPLTARSVFQTVVDVCIATPCRVAVYVVSAPLIAIGVGVVRGFHDVGEYVRGEGGGLRLLASVQEAERRRLEGSYMRTLPRAPYEVDHD